MMTPDQRYFFDLTGYLHLRDVLSPAELAPAQAAADHYISMPPAEWPPEFGADPHTPRPHWLAARLCL